MGQELEAKLYLVATPIGNLGDMSPRAVEVLKSASLIAAEDTRGTIRLLNHFGIKTPMTSYHQYSGPEKARELAEKVLAGEAVAVVTDAGMPAVSDPGEELVRAAYELGAPVSVIPGPCAAVSALAVSGLPTGRFVFEGFLPRERREREEILEGLKDETRTVILYEAPHRLGRTLEQLRDALGGGRRISLVRELTKIHEEVRIMTLAEAAAAFAPEPGGGENAGPRGEYVLVLEGRDRGELLREEQKEWEALSVPEHVALYERQGMDRKEAMRMAAKDRGVSRREIYQNCLEEKDE